MFYDDWVLFRVPIYRESRDAYHDRVRANQEQRIEAYLNQARSIGIPDIEDVERYWRENPPPFNPERKAWRFDRIIGWIEFYADGMKIKTNLYLLRGRATWPLRNVVIDYRGKLADVADAHYRDNEHLVDRIETFLTDVQRGHYGKRLARYKLDVEDTVRLIRYTDLKGLLQFLQDSRSKRDDA